VAKQKSVHQCTTCGATAAKWAGKCADCGDWNTMELVSTKPGVTSAQSALALSMVGDVSSPSIVPTGLGEVDRVLGGGLVAGSVTLLGGEPGIGKSTLALQLGVEARNCIYVSGEESVEQVARRATRIEADVSNLSFLQETEVGGICATIAQHKPALVIVDSIQTLHLDSVDSSAGTVAQVRACAAELVGTAKANGIAILIIGHVTKEGALAGPRTLEHLVDTVMEFEGDRHQGLRFLRAVKHRFGATDEVGVMEMTEQGMVGVPDASGMFLDDRRPGVSGSVVVPALIGRRPVLVELQSLVVDSNPGQSRRVAQGLDYSRLSLVLAVLHKRVRVNCSQDDVYASVVGGFRVDEPATDLALALAVASSKLDFAIPSDLVIMGELGLGGEVRRVGGAQKRLVEAQRLGFKRAIVPVGCSGEVSGMEIIEVDSLATAIESVTGSAVDLRSRGRSGAHRNAAELIEVAPKK
jgi:DNA repair protein RadA/Sms